MDKNAILSRFVEHTQLDPGLARDLLEGERWNYEAALKDYRELQGQRRVSLQKQDQHRSTPSPNTAVVQPTQNRTSPISNGHGDPSTVQNGGGTSPNGLQTPQLREAPRSPAAKRRMERGLSTANAQIVGLNRQRVIEDEERHDQQLVETPRFTFILPDLHVFPQDFRAFVEKDLIDSCTMINLENSGHLNWWAKTGVCPKLWPMTTSGDGNCLLHAASLGMWGFHDRQLTLRKALYKDLADNQHTAHMQKLKRRWRWQQTLANKESGLVYSEAEWEEEWRALLKLASTVPRNQRYKANGNKPTGGGTLPSLAEDHAYQDDDEEVMYESLEEFHVFVLCHILRRPIIIVADTVLRDSHGQPLAPIPFGGIYLPVETHPVECHRSPLVLTYDASHFSALVPMEVDSHRDPELRKKHPVIPLTNSRHQLLPLHFIVDPGLGWEWKDENHNFGSEPKLTTKTKAEQNKTKFGSEHINETKSELNKMKSEEIGTELGLSRLVYSPEDKLRLLQKYLDLVRLEIPEGYPESPTPGDQDWELLPPKENGVKTVKVEVSRSNSSGSEKSDKSSGKEKDKSRSLGKKLKSLTRMDKSKKSSRKDGKEQFHVIEEKSRETNSSSPPSSSVRIEDVADRSIIVAGKMDDMRLQGHEEMIRNYLDAAKVRFQEELGRKRVEDTRGRHNQRFQHNPIPEAYSDDDERTNETAYSYTSIPRARLANAPRNAPPARQDYYDGPQSRGTAYANAGGRSQVPSYHSNQGMPVERISPELAYHNQPARRQQQGHYSPQPVRANYTSQQHYQQPPPARQQVERIIPIQRLHVDERNQEIRSNPNIYATHARGKRVVLSPEEKGLKPCRTYGCKYYGTNQRDFLCSECYDSIMRKKNPSMW